MPQDAPDRLEVGPARHGVVAHQEEATRSQPLLGDRQNLIPYLLRHPAKHTVERDEFELPEVIREPAEISRQHPRIRELSSSNLLLHDGRMVGIHIDADKLTVRIGSRQRRQGPAKAAAEFEIAKALRYHRRLHAIERGHIPHGDGSHIRIEAGDV